MLLHFLHAFESQPHIFGRRLPRLFDEAVKQQHASTDNAKDYPAYPSVCQIAAHFPKPVSKAAAIRHPDGPAKLHLLDIAAGNLAIRGRESFEPVPDGLVSRWRFVEECR